VRPVIFFLAPNLPLPAVLQGGSGRAELRLAGGYPQACGGKKRTAGALNY